MNQTQIDLGNRQCGANPSLRPVASPCRFMLAFQLPRRHGIGIKRLDTVSYQEAMGLSSI
jgi:hypothetical protein